MARQFIYHMQGLSKTYPGQPQGPGEHPPVVLSRTPRSACSASTAPASRRCCASWPASTRNSPARPGPPRARASAIWRRSRSSIRQSRVRGNVMEGVAAKKAILDRYNELAVELFRRDRRRDDQAAGRDRGQGPVGPRLQGRSGDGRAALPAGRRRRGASSRAASGAASRCAGCCWRSPTCCCSTSRPTTSTPNRCLARRAICATIPGAILIVTHDRYFLDNVTGWILELDRGRGIPYEGNYSAWLEQKQKRLEQEGREEEARQRTLAREQEWIAASPRARQAKVQGALPALRGAAGEGRRQGAADRADRHPGRRAARAERRSTSRTCAKGFGDKLLIDDLTFKLPPGGIVGVIGPNGAGKTTLFRMITGQEKPDGGTHQDRRDGAARLRRPVARHARRRARPSGRRSPAASTSCSSASAR